MGNKTKSYFVITFLTFTVFFHCTKNTLFDDKLGENRLIVKGKVQLTDEATPNQVFVWLEGINVSTFTDSMGKFELHLPANETQPGGGLNGIYKIYYYIENYRIAVSTVAIVDGNFTYGQEDINEKGEIHRTLFLKKLVDIKTTAEISPKITVLKVSLVPTDKSVKVISYKSGDGHLTSYFIKTFDAAGAHASIFGLGRGQKVSQDIARPEEWIISLQSALPNEKLEVIPYIKIVQQDVPSELIEKLGVKTDDFDLDYLKIPFKRDFSVLTNEIVGIVRLSDNSSPRDAFIWLEGFNISKVADVGGNFSFEIPPSMSRPEGVLNGDFKIYYYVGNYQFDTSSVVVERGRFAYGKGEVDYSGRIRSKTLQKLLDIRTTVEPNKIGWNRDIKISVFLNPADSSRSSVEVETYKDVDDNLANGFIQKLGTTIYDAILASNGGTLIRESISEKTEWTMHHSLSPSIGRGEYKFIPYINIKQEGLPSQLIESIGRNSDHFHKYYLRTPFKRDGGEFVIK